ncbi:FUSC family protein [Ureibacillus aquaedulcis]|uniref:FUSC family protein n=1 Tax=Ureibacillus aquaedulcis TaxID=3058421 RepID=A0ABT8GPS9_9BACL|nr:FUSC family protein [Ureibacillus sp. BA0131]MDN4493417.1 FUSC family protein [Ureibacillus sp. BA0131]
MGETKAVTPSIFRQALTVNKKPFPWLKALLAGIAAGLPIAIGLLFGNFQYGLIAGLGGFTFLYVFPIPYAQLAKKLAWCVLAIAICVFLGTLLAPYPFITAIMMGLIGSIGVFVFGAFRLVGPSAFFFVLIFAMVTGMPVAPEEAFTRSGLAFLGGLLSWSIAMGGWLFNPHGPEKNIVQRSYLELANYFEAIGTVHENAVQHRVISTLKEASETMTSGYISWKKSDMYNYLVVLNDFSHKIYLFSVEQQLTERKDIPEELGQSLRKMAEIIDSKNIYDAASINLPHPNEMDENIAQIFIEMNAVKNSLLKSSVPLKQQADVQMNSAKRILLGAFDKNSIIFINALRFGAITTLAAIFAFEFEFNRSFWIPLSCVAVMSGATVIASLHRAIQRSFGTIFGILIASAILFFQPTGYMVALLIFLLTFITELFIVKNYGLAALFFTPAALIMAEAGSNGKAPFSFIASARLVDVVIGIIIGLIGVWFVGRKSASSRTPHLVSKTIRSHAQAFYTLFSKQEIYHNEINKMETNIRNLRTIFDTATGELPKDEKTIDYYWPIVYSLEELGFLLEKCAKSSNRPLLNDSELAQYLLAFESMAIAADRRNYAEKRNLPEIAGFQSIVEKIEQLQSSMLKH